MPDEARRTILRAGLASAAASLAPWPGRASGGSQQKEGGMAEAKRRVELPGFVDLQVNGFVGVDFTDPNLTQEGVLKAVAAIEKTGVTRFLPTLITSSFETFAASARTVVRTKHPAIVGIHMEGPYISPEDGPRGAHLRQFVRDASIEDFRRRQDAAEGGIVLVTVAPEVPGIVPLIEYLVSNKVRAAIGHSNANGAQIGDAVKAGATMSTHLGNGCANMLPRHPNVIWEQLGEDRLLAGFIVDGHHLPPATVKSMIRAKTPARTILVTDAVGAAGMPPGRYTLGGQLVELSPSGRVAVPGAPNLAGSALRLDVAIGNAVKFTGLPLEEVVGMASTRPAEYIGIPPAGEVHAEWDPAASTLNVLRVTT